MTKRTTRAKKAAPKDDVAVSDEAKVEFGPKEHGDPNGVYNEIFKTVRGNPEIALTIDATKGGAVTIHGPTLAACKDAGAIIWKVIGRLKKQGKIDQLPEINHEVG